jgi:hypothetical protein
MVGYRLTIDYHFIKGLSCGGSVNGLFDAEIIYYSVSRDDMMRLIPY